MSRFLSPALSTVIPYTPGGMSDLAAQMRDALLGANAANPANPAPPARPL